MSDTSLAGAEREEIEMLLPWYVTGKLDAADHARVEAYLADHPEVAHQLDLVRAEREETVAANEALGWPSPAAMERLMAALPARRPGAGILQRLKERLRQVTGRLAASTAGAPRWAAVAAALVIAVQAVAIATLVSQRSATPGAYETAAGAESGEGVLLLVTFADDAKATAISQFLAELDGSIVDGPRAGGVYKIRVRTDDRSPAAREALMRKLAERRDVIGGVLPSRD